MPGKRGLRFQPNPTSNARSAVDTVCEVFVTKSARKPSGGGSHEGEVFRFRHLGHYTCSASLRRPCQAFVPKPFARFFLRARIIAKTLEPVNAMLFPKPGELALRVAPRGLLNRGARLFEFCFSTQNLAQFTVADEIE